MTPEQEDALAQAIETQWIAGGTKSVRDIVRLAIRAAVAQERERCAYICDRWDGTGEVIAEAIAAAIRRGE